MFPLLAIAAAQSPHDAFLTYHRGYLSSPGGCISETGNTGTYSELWGKTEAECRGECDASALCLGYEFSVVKVERYRLCELHSVLPTDAVPVPGASKGAGGGGGGTASCAQDRAFNLGGAVRNGENLQDARLGGKFLSRASFQSAYLVGATLAGATATDASFVNANMERANLEALHGAGADSAPPCSRARTLATPPSPKQPSAACALPLSMWTLQRRRTHPNLVGNAGANLVESRFDGASLYSTAPA